MPDLGAKGGEAPTGPEDDAAAVARSDEAERVFSVQAEDDVPLDAQGGQVTLEAENDVPVDAQGGAARPQVVQLAPDDHLRKVLVYLLVLLIVVALGMVCFGLGFHWFDTDFSNTILQVIVGPVVGTLAAVVGYLFGERKSN